MSTVEKAAEMLKASQLGLTPLEPAQSEPSLSPPVETVPEHPAPSIERLQDRGVRTFVFTDYFHYSRSKAEKLMMEVHEDGRSVVSTGSREEMERDVQAMHEYGLWATMERAS